MKKSKTSFSCIFFLSILVSISPEIVKANNVSSSIGPIIQMKETSEGRTFDGPGDFQINFVSYNPDKVVDMESLRVVYVKFINIDITEKIRPYIRGNSIVVPKKSLPEGNHKFQIKIKDSHKNESEQTFLIRVSKQQNY